MLYFGIPLKARKVSADWDRVTELLDNTLRSIFNQSDPDFKVFVACHDVPEVRHRDDPRLEFLPVDFAPPIFRDEQMVDKHRKREVIGSRLRAEGGGYMMFVDADDLVSNRIAAYVHRDQAPRGYVITDGYELDFARWRVRIAPRFNYLSGTMAVVKWAPEELPETPLGQETSRLRDILNCPHPTWRRVFEERGRPLKALPFRGAMYVMNTTENWSDMMQHIGPRRRLIRYVTPTSRPSAAIVQEFALDR